MPNYSRLLLRLVQTTLAEVDRSRSGETRDPSSSAPSRKPSASEGVTPPRDLRRTMAGLLAFLLLLSSAVLYATSWMVDWTGSESTSKFIISAMTRIGLVLGAIWLAWDSMRRPARWVPPGLAVAGVVGIIVVAAQPKLIFAIVPLLGGLAVLTSIVRVFRNRP